MKTAAEQEMLNARCMDLAKRIDAKRAEVAEAKAELAEMEDNFAAMVARRDA